MENFQFNKPKVSKKPLKRFLTFCIGVHKTDECEDNAGVPLVAWLPFVKEIRRGFGGELTASPAPCVWRSDGKRKIFIVCKA